MNARAQRPPGRPRDQEKRAAILAAATACFLELGFARATMDAVAARAGVSKLTVYNHFASKEALFRALVAAKCDEHFAPAAFESLASLGAAAALNRVAVAFVELMGSPDVLALHRVLLAGTPPDPAISRAFYDSGPAPTLAALARLLKAFHRSGELAVPDADVAADHFFALLEGKWHLRALLQLPPVPGRRQLRAHAARGVAVFLRAYAP